MIITNTAMKLVCIGLGTSQCLIERGTNRAENKAAMLEERRNGLE